MASNVTFLCSFQEVLTPQKCELNIIVRGLVRVRCVQEMDRVLHFMTRKGLINTGVLTVKRPLLPERYSSVSVNIRSLKKKKERKKEIDNLIRNLWTLQRKVIVIGAGASGLAAARQLQNFGTQVDDCLHFLSTIWVLRVGSPFVKFKCVLIIPGRGAGGQRSDRWPRLGRHLSGCHCRTRSSNRQRLCEQPHRLDVWAGSDWSLKRRNRTVTPSFQV